MLAVIAGTGALPAAVVRAAAASGQTPVICQLQGFVAEGLPGLPKITFRLETLGTLIQSLVAEGVTRVCFAGAIRRPDVNPALIDAATAPMVPRLMAALAKGDDGALRVVFELFEEAGLEIIAAHDLAPQLLMPQGALTARTPTEAQHRQARAALAPHALMSSQDRGQALIMADGAVIAEEGPDGTDAMLRGLIRPDVTGSALLDDPIGWVLGTAEETLDQVADWLSNHTAPEKGGMAEGGILFKAPKVGQDRRADLPVIGPQTVMLAAEVGLTGIALEQGGVMIVDRPQVIQIADAMAMSIWSVEPRA